MLKEISLKKKIYELNDVFKYNIKTKWRIYVYIVAHKVSNCS